MEPIQLGAMRLLKRLRPLVDGLSSTHVAARLPLVAVGRCAARVWLAVRIDGQQAGGSWRHARFLVLPVPGGRHRTLRRVWRERNKTRAINPWH
jgi:hypothetical protein